jgi:hypothetical protein
VPPELAAVLAVYAAVVSTALGVLRWIEFGESRRRIVFSVVLSEIVEPILISLGGSEPPTFRRTLLVVHLNNRGPVPIPLNKVSFMLKNGEGLIFNQAAGMPQTDKIDPSDSYMLGIEPAQLLKAIGPKGEGQVVRVQCHDRAGREYGRRISGADRKQIRLTLEYAEKNPPKP